MGDPLVDALNQIENEKQTAGQQTRSAVTNVMAAGRPTALDPELSAAIGVDEDEDWSIFGVEKELAKVRLRMGKRDVKLGNALASFFVMPREQLALLQRKLWEAGLYDSAYYPTRTGTEGIEPAFGTPDEDSYSAYRVATLRAARRQIAERVSQGQPMNAPPVSQVQEPERPDLSHLGPAVTGRGM